MPTRSPRQLKLKFQGIINLWEEGKITYISLASLYDQNPRNLLEFLQEVYYALYLTIQKKDLNSSNIIRQTLDALVQNPEIFEQAVGGLNRRLWADLDPSKEYTMNQLQNYSTVELRSFFRHHFPVNYQNFQPPTLEKRHIAEAICSALIIHKQQQQQKNANRPEESSAQRFPGVGQGSERWRTSSDDIPLYDPQRLQRPDQGLQNTTSRKRSLQDSFFGTSSYTSSGTQKSNQRPQQATLGDKPHSPSNEFIGGQSAFSLGQQQSNQRPQHATLGNNPYQPSQGFLGIRSCYSSLGQQQSNQAPQSATSGNRLQPESMAATFPNPSSGLQQRLQPTSGSRTDLSRRAISGPSSSSYIDMVQNSRRPQPSRRGTGASQGSIETSLTRSSRGPSQPSQTPQQADRPRVARQDPLGGPNDYGVTPWGIMSLSSPHGLPNPEPSSLGAYAGPSRPLSVMLAEHRIHVVLNTREYLNLTRLTHRIADLRTQNQSSPEVEQLKGELIEEVAKMISAEIGGAGETGIDVQKEATELVLELLFSDG